MSVTDDEILFRRIKDVALRSPARSTRFKAFVMSRAPAGYEFHHVMTSTHSLKSTDFLAVAVSHSEHLRMQRDRAWIVSKLPEAIYNLLQYTKELESKHDRTLDS